MLFVLPVVAAEKVGCAQKSARLNRCVRPAVYLLAILIDWHRSNAIAGLDESVEKVGCDEFNDLIHYFG